LSSVSDIPTDFAHLATRDAVDKALQRLVAAGNLRRIDRGLYDKPVQNKLTAAGIHRTTAPWWRRLRAATSSAYWWTASLPPTTWD
jgi:hypothetical protein